MMADLAAFLWLWVDWILYVGGLAVLLALALVFVFSLIGRIIKYFGEASVYVLFALIALLTIAFIQARREWNQMKANPRPPVERPEARTYDDPQEARR